MLNELINSLTKEQKVELFAKDIPPQLVSAWKHGRRRPTYEQCVSLAVVTGCDLKELLLEMALADAREEDKIALKNILKK